MAPTGTDTPIMLITGASAGIGAATATLAAQRGYDVAINYRSDSDGAKATAAAVRAAGRRALVLQADVADPAAVTAMFAALDDGLGRLSVLVNNAGIVDTAARIEDVSPERLQRMFAVNVFGSVYCAQAAVRRMARRHGGAGGAIVNITSVAARLAAPGTYGDYAAAKGAIDVLTRTLALENADEGLRVNAVRPGIIETDIHAKGGDPDRAHRLSAEAVPMRRPGSAQEVAEAILWLASDAASYVTGDILTVGGGR